MSIGEPQHAIPDFVPEILHRHAASLNRYPPNEGIPELRRAISDWLGRRYGVAEAYRDILPQPVRNGIRHSRTVDEVTRKEGEAAIVWFKQVLSQ